MAVDKFLVVVVLTVDHNNKLHISTKFYEGFDSSLRDDWQWFKELSVIVNSDLTVSAHSGSPAGHQNSFPFPS